MTLEMALVTLVNECVKHNTCKNCPLRTIDGDCYLNQNYPHEWSFAEQDDAPPRIFE